MIKNQSSFSSTSTHLYSIPIKSLDPSKIEIPFSLYPIQKRMLPLIIQAINSKKSIVIESPTGTGKTICLLASTLEALKQKGADRIYYLTRTHSQMNNIVEEINKIKYQPMFSILQSKKGLCVHEPAIKQGAAMNIEEFNDLCFSAIRDGEKARTIIEKCPMATNVDIDKLNLSDLKTKIKTVKDIKNYAKDHKICPQRLQNTLSNSAQLVIMPYIYMINSLIYEQKKFNLENSIVIFDEAHNVLDQARQQSSVDLNLRVIEYTRMEIETLIGLNPISFHVQKAINILGETPINVSSKGQTIQVLKKYYEKLVLLVNMLKYSFSQNSNQVVVFSLEQIRHRLQFTFKGFKQFRKNHTSLIQKLIFQLKQDSKGKKYISNFIQICYKLQQILTNPVKNAFMCSMSMSQYKKLEIKFNCLTSRFVFEKLNKKHTVFIFASGTIKSEQFRETGLKMFNNFSPKYPLQNPYPNNNIATFYVSKNDYYQSLQIDFKNPDYEQVISYLKNTIPMIPNGVLVFFKSSIYLDKIREIVNYRHIDFGKQIFYESKQDPDFNSTIAQYKQTAKTQEGAILFGYMKGKASQGCNFQNQCARAVFVVGFPLDYIKSLPCQIHKKLGDFKEWYPQDAIKAVNQGIGRVVRNRYDYGLIFLLGRRVVEIVNDLPEWLRMSIEFQNINTNETKIRIRQFFEGKQSKMAKVKEQEIGSKKQDNTKQEDYEDLVEQFLYEEHSGGQNDEMMD